MNHRESLLPQLQQDYSRYYTYRDSDSPEFSRSQLIDEIIRVCYDYANKQKHVTVLDIGAGKQILERELQERNNFIPLKSRVQFVTIDLAEMSDHQLLTNNTPHIQANGAELPFADNTFDIVFSSMAIDFMPRTAFSEVKRVAKTNAHFLANFHHSNLVTIAQSNKERLISQEIARKKKLSYGRNSPKKDMYKAKWEEAKQELADALFIIKHFPQVIFYSEEEVTLALQEYLNPLSLVVQENQGVGGQNGWFFAKAEIDKNKRE